MIKWSKINKKYLDIFLKIIDFQFFFYWDMILLFVQCQHNSCYGYRRVLFRNNEPINNLYDK